MRFVRTIGRWLLAALVLVASRRRRRRERASEPVRLTRVRSRAGGAGGERAVLVCLAVASICFAAFIASYVVDASNALLGLTLGLGLAGLAAACAVAGKTLVAQTEVTEPRPVPQHPEAVADVVDDVSEGASRLTRRRVLFAAAGATGMAAAAFAAPLASLGPAAGDLLEASPWRRGRRLVDEGGRPLLASILEVGSFATAFPEGADRELLASPLVVVRVLPSQLRLPAGREHWAPDGILAFSKICTHAGCAIGLFRYPAYAPTSSKPALVCPCHYSTFDVTRGALPVFGPAVRSLPQLPLAIDGSGALVAAGPLSGRVGPSWLLVDRR